MLICTVRKARCARGPSRRASAIAGQFIEHTHIGAAGSNLRCARRAAALSASGGHLRCRAPLFRCTTTWCSATSFSALQNTMRESGAFNVKRRRGPCSPSTAVILAWMDAHRLLLLAGGRRGSAGTTGGASGWPRLGAAPPCREPFLPGPLLAPSRVWSALFNRPISVIMWTGPQSSRIQQVVTSREAGGGLAPRHVKALKSSAKRIGRWTLEDVLLRQKALRNGSRSALTSAKTPPSPLKIFATKEQLRYERLISVTPC